MALNPPILNKAMYIKEIYVLSFFFSFNELLLQPFDCQLFLHDRDFFFAFFKVRNQQFMQS